MALDGISSSLFSSVNQLIGGNALKPQVQPIAQASSITGGSGTQLAQASTPAPAQTPAQPAANARRGTYLNVVV